MSKYEKGESKTLVIIGESLVFVEFGRKLYHRICIINC